MKHIFKSICPIILASGSLRRQQFFHDLGLLFEIKISTNLEPLPLAHENPTHYALRLAQDKAQAIGLCSGKLVVAADTIVVLADNTILGKPTSPADALRMLKLLSGMTHTVITAVHLILPDSQNIQFQQSSQVTFHSWSEQILQAYVATGESADKAGGYAVQGQGSFLIENITGSWTNVVGLPMSELVAKLTDLKILLPEDYLTVF